MPIKGRIEMLSTGIRTPIGIKISGDNVKTIEAIGAQIESLLPQVKGPAAFLPSAPEVAIFLISIGTGRNWPAMV